jgi:hypothetical protein
MLCAVGREIGDCSEPASSRFSQLTQIPADLLITPLKRARLFPRSTAATRAALDVPLYYKSPSDEDSRATAEVDRLSRWRTHDTDAKSQSNQVKNDGRGERDR